VIKTWSYSRLTVFEQCPLRAKLAFIDRIPEPERPLPPGKTEHANDRGTRIHEAAEMFVRGGVELIPELQHFLPEFENLRTLYAQGKVSLEGEWGINREWKPVAWMDRDVWCRVKLDAMVRLHPEQAVVIDYKTGKKSGNEVKHAEQGQLYAVGTANRNPELEEVIVEFWYTDQNEITSKIYDLDDIEHFRQKFHDRGITITSAMEFPAKPNIFNCKWCPYGPKGTGHCQVGVQK
jgi:hypothetical protein